MVLNDDEKESCYQEKYLGENTNKLNEICQAQLGTDPQKSFHKYLIGFCNNELCRILIKAANCQCIRFLKRMKWQKCVE